MIGEISPTRCNNCVFIRNGNKKRNCCILLDLFNQYKAWCTEPKILKSFYESKSFGESVWSLTPSSWDIKNEGSYSSTPPYICLAYTGSAFSGHIHCSKVNAVHLQRNQFVSDQCNNWNKPAVGLRCTYLYLYLYLSRASNVHGAESCFWSWYFLN